MKHRFTLLILFSILLVASSSCDQKTPKVRLQDIQAMGLKPGPIVLCGPSDNQVGKVSFAITGDDKTSRQFNFATALLHSFEYDEAEKAFANIIEEEPDCAMAYWGVAMCNYHPLWTPPEEPELIRGSKALTIAASVSHKTQRESDYIQALSIFYADWKTVDYKTRCNRYETAMETMYKKYPDDPEAAIFYALALDAAADPKDKSYSRQKKAGGLLQALYSAYPNHPGIIHYLIHTYDSPELAEMGRAAAEKYASVAPASAHAQHMPSHIFVRLGLWDDCIRSNQASMASAQCYAESTGLKGHWDEELHSMDYVVYGYLQKGDTARAIAQWNTLKSFDTVQPVNLKVAYAYAAIPARIALEGKLWKQAAALQLFPAHFPWERFPWQESIVHFARILGAVHTGQLRLADTELHTLYGLHEKLLTQKESYKANEVAIQIKAAEGWRYWRQGKKPEALASMTLAANMEDSTEKHPVTPGEVLPARELLGDLLLEMDQPKQALVTYNASLKKHPNRYNSLLGIRLAEHRQMKTGDQQIR